jgi:hypothetical protein
MPPAEDVRAELPVQVIPRHAGFVARSHRPLTLQPGEQPTDVLRVIRDLPQSGAVSSGRRIRAPILRLLSSSSSAT